MFPTAGWHGAPLSTVGQSAQRPLSVRRQTPEVLKHRVATVQLPSRELPLAFDASESDADGSARVADVVRTTHHKVALYLRLAAWLLDALVLLGVDGAIVYLTARLAGVPLAGVEQLPQLPFLSFMLLLNAGYIVALTVMGGQTVGKMAVGLRVETTDGAPVTLGRALGRTAAGVFSVLPAGVGCVGLVLGRGRALHDVLAGTRVVRVS